MTDTWKNESRAVMARRLDPVDAPDDFPTPPWATRALVQYLIGFGPHIQAARAHDPCCGRGHMVLALHDYFGPVTGSDIADYGAVFPRADFLSPRLSVEPVDWVIANPPFKLAEEFIRRAFAVARVGVAMLVRSSFAEGVGRYERLYAGHPPYLEGVFAERVPMVKGRIDPKASTATAYSWLLWRPWPESIPTVKRWIPPCRKILEREGDYEQNPFERGKVAAE